MTVDISHRVPSQLEISLTPPEGERIVLHNRIPVSGTGISATYTVAHPALRSLLGEYVKGIWLAEVHDRARGTSGTFNSWELEIEYEPPHPPEIPPSTPQRDIVADDFGSDLRKWKEEGGTNWSVGSRATRNLVEPGLPNDPILKASSCRQACTISLKDAVDLTPYSDAGLWFSRNVDPAIGSNGYLRVQVYDGTGWTTIADWTHNRGDDGRWHKEYYNLADYLDVDDFNVRFVTHQGRSNEVVAINDFRITTGDGAVAPAPKKIDFTAELGGDRSLIVLRFTKPVIESFAASDFELSHGKVDSVTNFASSKTRHLAVSGIPYDVQVKVTYSPRLQRLSADATPGLASGASSSTNAVFNPDPSAARGSVAISDDFESGTGSWSLERYGRIRSVVPATEPGAAIPGLPADNSAMRLYTCYHGCLAQPEGSVDATSPLIVGFDRYVERHSKDDRINVEYSTDSGSTWKVAASFREADGALAGTWVRESVMLDATASVTHLRLAIYVKSGSTYIDNFSVRSIPTSAVPDTATTHAFQFHGGLPSWTLTGDYETLWTAGAPAAAVDGQTAADRAMIASDCDRYCYAQLGYALDASAPLLVSLDKYVDRSASRLDGLYVQYSTDGGTSWTNLAEYTGNTDDDDSTWSREVLSLDAQEGEALLRLAAYSLNDREKVEVDNLVIQQKPPDPASLPAVTLKASLDEANEVMTVVLSTGLYKTFKASDFALDAGSVDSLEHSPGSDTVVLGVSGVPPGREVTVSYTGAPHIVGLNHGAELRRSESATVMSSIQDSPPVVRIVHLPLTLPYGDYSLVTIYASDPDGDEITFTLVNHRDFVFQGTPIQDRLTLTIAPRFNHVGTHDVGVLVSAGGASTWANFTVNVFDTTPPSFHNVMPLTFKSVHLRTPVHFEFPDIFDFTDKHIETVSARQEGRPPN
ncbi:MAG: proprotein convertase P-domain-containing protein, partial [Nitrosopumilus sp.]|nr:proprotein convertase P-domain-containing protein [Nitrosopumilus sp.]